MQERLLEWANLLSNVTLPSWTQLPTLGLYSEQVITYIRELLWFIDSEDEPVITKAMINNYVKHEIIPKPINKKYTQAHIAHLIAISSLKQVLSLPQIKSGIEYQCRITGIEGTYDLYRDEMNFCFKDITQQISTQRRIESQLIDDRRKALNFASNALVYKLMAAKIVDIRAQLDKEKELLLAK